MNTYFIIYLFIACAQRNLINHRIQEPFRTCWIRPQRARCRRAARPFSPTCPRPSALSSSYTGNKMRILNEREFTKFLFVIYGFPKQLKGYGFKVIFIWEP